MSEPFQNPASRSEDASGVAVQSLEEISTPARRLTPMQCLDQAIEEAPLSLDVQSRRYQELLDQHGHEAPTVITRLATYHALGQNLGGNDA